MTTDDDDMADLDIIDADAPDFRRIASIANSVTPDDHLLDTPPPGVWDAIAAELRHGAAHARSAGADPLAVDDPTVAEERPLAAVSRLPSTRGNAGARSRRFATLALAAAAAVFIVVVLAGTLLLGDDGAVVQAAAPLLSLDGSADEIARAELVRQDDGLAVRVELEGLEIPADGFLELWVIDTDVVRMHSLGVVAADGTFTLPPGLDPADFPVVDISVEPVDGDPTHSGVSVARGVLAPA